MAYIATQRTTRHFIKHIYIYNMDQYCYSAWPYYYKIFIKTIAWKPTAVSLPSPGARHLRRRPEQTPPDAEGNAHRPHRGQLARDEVLRPPPTRRDRTDARLLKLTDAEPSDGQQKRPTDQPTKEVNNSSFLRSRPIVCLLTLKVLEPVHRPVRLVTHKP